MTETNPICGKWRVKMRGWWWCWFRNVKYIWQNIDGSIQGYNVLWGWRKWGEFDVEEIELETVGSQQFIFTYKLFKDTITLGGKKAIGYLWVIDWQAASFTMSRILPKQIDK